MTHLGYNTEGLLCAYPGEAEKTPCFTWTYSTFENFLNESVTPSMYEYMASYVCDTINEDELLEIQNGEYWVGDLEASAVDAYFNEPIIERIKMHEQTLVNLRDKLRRAEDRESSAIDAMLEENKPFDYTSPINKEYCEFMRGIITDAREKMNQLEREIHEESMWVGGHERGAEDEV